MMDPFDFAASFGADARLPAYDVVLGHGFVYGLATETWRGDAAPPSTNNVQTRSEVLRSTTSAACSRCCTRNDRYRGDDDICVETSTPTPTGRRSACSRRRRRARVTDCRAAGSRRHLRRASPGGTTTCPSAASRPASSPRTPSSATPPTTVRSSSTSATFDVGYDAAGNPIIIITTREDGASHAVTLDLRPVRPRPGGGELDATGAPPLEIDARARSRSRLEPARDRRQRDAVRRDFDGFGRLVRTTSRRRTARSACSRLTLPRLLRDRPARPPRSSPRPSAIRSPGTAGAAAADATVYLDELGRERRTEIELGDDYGRDAGRRARARTTASAAWRSRPTRSRASQDAPPRTAPPITSGRRIAALRHPRPRAAAAPTVTDEPGERYPTCFTARSPTTSETLGVRDAASLLAGSPQAGVISRDADRHGPVLARSTWQNGARLEHARFRTTGSASSPA